MTTGRARNGIPHRPHARRSAGALTEAPVLMPRRNQATRTRAPERDATPSSRPTTPDRPFRDPVKRLFDGRPADHNGGYRVPTVTSDRDTALRTLESTSDLIAELARPVSSVVIDVGARRSACSAVERFAPRECGRDLPWVKLGIEALMWGMQAVAGKPRSSSGSSNADHAIRSRG